MKIFTKLKFGVVAVVGVLAAICLAGTAGAAELIVNGGFETGDFTGWTQGGNTGFTLVGSDNPNSGTFAADLGPVGSDGTLVQTIPTVAGQHYTFSFWLFSNGGTPNHFAAVWDGGLPVFDQTDIPAHGYTQYAFDVVGAPSFTNVGFSFRDDPSFLNLDDVSVNTIPEPEIYAMMGIGLLLMGFVARRRKGQAAAA